MGASSSIAKGLHNNQSGGFEGTEIPPEEQGQLVIPLQNITRHLRLFQHCVSGELLILVEQVVSQVKEVTDTSEWYEVRISGLQQPYFESLTRTKFVSAPAPQTPRSEMELSPEEQFKHLDPNSKTYAAAVMMAKALKQQGVKFPIGADNDSDVPERIIRPRPPPLLYPRPSENASQQNQSSDTGSGDVAAPTEDFNRERDAAEVKAQLEPQFGHDFDITPHTGAGGRASLRVVCRACLEEVEEGRAKVGGWGRQMATGGAPVLTAFALSQLAGEGKYAQDVSPRQKLARSDRGGPAQWREVLSQHRLGCMSSLHLSDRLRELDLHLRPIISSLTACNFDMMFGQMSRAIRIFEDKCAINNFVLGIVRRVVDVQLVPKGLLIPSAGHLLRNVDLVVDDINELVAVMRRWLSGGGAVKTFTSGRLPSIFAEPPPPIDHELEMELIRHVDVLVDTLEVAQQKKQILQNFKLSNVSLSSFRFVRKLGKGAFASVYLARRGANYVVLKTMSKAHVRERGMTGQVILEQRVLRASSRSQPQLFVLFAASFQTSSRLFLALEYIPGGDCASLLASMPKGFIPEPTARLIAGEVAYAVKHMHDHGIVHRDIKPDNILITATGHIKLTDFGMATPRDRKQNRHAAHGPGTSSSDTHSSDYSYGGESFGAQVYGLHDKVPQWLDLYGGFRRNIVALNALNLNRNGLGGSPGPIEVMMQVQGTADSSASDGQMQVQSQSQGQGQGQGQRTDSMSIPKLIAPPKFRTVAGNYHYASPEAIQRHVCGHEVDWWALGVLLYQFLAGLLPFADPPDPTGTRERDGPEERESVMARILACKPHMKELPTSLVSAPYTYNRNDLLLGLWVRDPNHRLGHLSGSHVLNHPYFRESPTAIPTPASLRQPGPLMLQIGGPGDTSYYPPEADSFEKPSWWPSEANDDAAIMTEDGENKEDEFPSYTTVGSLA